MKACTNRRERVRLIGSRGVDYVLPKAKHSLSVRANSIAHRGHVDAHEFECDGGGTRSDMFLLSNPAIIKILVQVSFERWLEVSALQYRTGAQSGLMRQHDRHLHFAQEATRCSTKDKSVEAAVSICAGHDHVGPGIMSLPM